MGPASITHITNFNHNRFINFPASLIVEFIKLSFHLFNGLAVLVDLTLYIFGFILFFKITKDFFIWFVMFFIFIIIANVNIYFTNFLIRNIGDAIISLFAFI